MQIPVKYVQRILLSDDNSKFFILQIETTVINRLSMGARGGLEFFISRKSVFSLGGGLISSKSRSPSRAIQSASPLIDFLKINQQLAPIVAYFASGGFDFFIEKNNTATLGIQLADYKLQNESTFKHSGIKFELHSFINKTSIININLFAVFQPASDYFYLS